MDGCQDTVHIYVIYSLLYTINSESDQSETTAGGARLYTGIYWKTFVFIGLFSLIYYVFFYFVFMLFVRFVY